MDDGDVDMHAYSSAPSSSSNSMLASSFDSNSKSLYTYRAGKNTVTKSGSNWSIEEAQIFRVSYSNTRDPHWPSSSLLSPLSNNPLWVKFVNNPDGLLGQTNKEIRSHFKELSGFFIALANILRPSFEEASANPRSSERAQKTRQQPNQASKQSLHDEIGSSSPAAPSSQGSNYDPALHAIDDDLDEQRERKQAEVASASLASAFISLVIDLFLDQTNSREKRLAFQESPTKFALSNRHKTVDCKCLDDGSIIWHEFHHLSQQWRSGGHVCSVETKNSFTQSDDEGQGRISSEMIPQYACELIGAIMQRVEVTEYDVEDDVPLWQPLITTHSSYITILSATFTPAYLKYIMGLDEINGDPPTIIHKTHTTSRF